MSEPEQPCIRLCLIACRCDHCKHANIPDHDPKPAPAVDGHLCRTCSNRLHRWLGSILEDTLTLTTRIPDNYGWDHGHTHSKISGSPALIRLEPAALLDPRTAPVSAGNPGEEDAAAYEENQSDIGRSIPWMVCSWAQLFTEENNLSTDVSTMAASVTLLTAWWDKLVASDWIDDFYTDLATIHQLLNRAHNRRPPTRIGRCFNCEETIHKQDGNGQDDALCRKCNRTYTETDQFKIRLQENHDQLDALITNAQITTKDAREYLRLKYPQHPTPRESTIRSWLTRGNITTTHTGGIDIKSMEVWFIQLRDQKQAHRRTPRAG